MEVKIFKECISKKDTLISDFEAEEFLDDFSEKIEEYDLLEEFEEDSIWNRIIEILTYITADALLELKVPIICELIRCDISELEKLCHYYSCNLVDTHQFYDVEKNDIDKLTFLNDDDACSHRHYVQNIVEKEEDEEDEEDKHVVII